MTFLSQALSHYIDWRSRRLKRIGYPTLKAACERYKATSKGQLTLGLLLQSGGTAKGLRTCQKLGWLRFSVFSPFNVSDPLDNIVYLTSIGYNYYIDHTAAIFDRQPHTHGDDIR